MNCPECKKPGTKIVIHPLCELYECECGNQWQEQQEPRKAWPDTFKEAKKISGFWGFCIDGHRHIIVSSGAAGYAIGGNFGCVGTWEPLESMENYWKNDGNYHVFEYYFQSFNSWHDLLDWVKGEV